jgi:hypothetical protein
VEGVEGVEGVVGMVGVEGLVVGGRWSVVGTAVSSTVLHSTPSRSGRTTGDGRRGSWVEGRGLRVVQAQGRAPTSRQAQ